MAETRSVHRATDVREFPSDRTEVVTVGTTTVTRWTTEPGWRWSKCMKPIAGTDSCQVPHNGYAISGRIRVREDDGTEIDINPGDAYSIPAGHDGWVLGDEPWVGVDSSPAMADFARTR